MNLTDIVDKGWDKAKRVARNGAIILTSTYLVLNTTACSLFNHTDPKEKVTITNEQPLPGSYSDKKVGEQLSFSFDSNSELGLTINNSYRVDGRKVDNDNKYTHTFNKKGVTTIEGIAKTKEDSSKVTWIYNIDNTNVTAIDTSITMNEDETRTIAKNKLLKDADGDNTYLNITSTNNVNATINNNGDLQINGLQDYNGPANINYQGTDNESTDNGTININFTPINDAPIANAGPDKTGTINEEITLDGSQSYDPDQTTITTYEWKTLNGNPNITNSDQANANFKTNTRGQYQIELTVTDPTGLTDKDTVNINIDSYKIIVNTTNVLNDQGIPALEVMLAGKTVTTNSQGTATLEYPTNVSTSGNLKIQDENIVGDIGEYFNYSDTESTSITGDIEYNVEMVPDVAYDSQSYTDILDFITHMRGHGIIGGQPGDWDKDYPKTINTNESEMPAEFYKRAADEAIDEINQELEMNVVEKTTDENAKYKFNYSQDNSRFSPDYIQKDGVWYIDDATVFIWNSASENSFERLKGEIKHEIFTHGLGWPYHSEDSQDLSSVPVYDSETTQNELKAKEVFLKLQGGTNIENYQIE
ncbi:MAG: PKD domain-containing protein [archaeon]